MNPKDERVRSLDAWRGRSEPMRSKEARTRALIADQAADWFVANLEGLDAEQRSTFVAWLGNSPLHIEEYLAVSSIARGVRDIATDPSIGTDALIEAARTPTEFMPRSRPPSAVRLGSPWR